MTIRRGVNTALGTIGITNVINATTATMTTAIAAQIATRDSPTARVTDASVSGVAAWVRCVARGLAAEQGELPKSGESEVPLQGAVRLRQGHRTTGEASESHFVNVRPRAPTGTSRHERASARGRFAAESPAAQLRSSLERSRQRAPLFEGLTSSRARWGPQRRERAGFARAMDSPSAHLAPKIGLRANELLYLPKERLGAARARPDSYREA